MEGEGFTAAEAVAFMEVAGSQAEDFTEVADFMGEAWASAVGDATPMAVFVMDIAVG